MSADTPTLKSQVSNLMKKTKNSLRRLSADVVIVDELIPENAKLPEIPTEEAWEFMTDMDDFEWDE